MNSDKTRDFYLDSLRDLEAEYEAGDISEEDYKELKAKYTKRASEAIDVKPKASKKLPRRVFSIKKGTAITLVIVLAMSLVAGIVLALNSGQRSGSDEISGDIRVSTNTLLSEGLILLDQATTARSTQLLAAARAKYGEVLDQDPANVEAQTRVAWTYYLENNLPEARIQIQEALSFNSTYPRALAIAAIVELESNFYDTAQGYYDDFLAANPSTELFNEYSSLQRQITATRLKDQYGGDKLADNVLEFEDINAEDLDEAVAIAVILIFPDFNFREPVVGLAILDLVLAMEPDNVGALVNRGILLTDTSLSGDSEELFEAGITSLNRAIELQPGDARLHRFRARAHLSAEDYDQALVDINTAISFDVENLDLYLEQAEIFYRAERYEEMLAAIDKAEELGPQNIRVFSFRAIRLALIDRYEEAIAQVDIALGLNPNQQDRSELESLRARIVDLRDDAESTPNTDGQNSDG